VGDGSDCRDGILPCRRIRRPDRRRGDGFREVAGRHGTAFVQVDYGTEPLQGIQLFLHRLSGHRDRREDLHVLDRVELQGLGIARDQCDGRKHLPEHRSEVVDLRRGPRTSDDIVGRTRVGQSSVHDAYTVRRRSQGRRYGVFQERI